MQMILVDRRDIFPEGQRCAINPEQIVMVSEIPETKKVIIRLRGSKFPISVAGTFESVLLDIKSGNVRPSNPFDFNDVGEQLVRQ